MYLMISALYCSEYVIIIKKDSPIKKISQNELNNIYLRRQNFFNNQKIIPVNTLADNKARIEFEKSVIKMSRTKLNKYWIKQHFRGVIPPPSVLSFDAALLFVNNVEGSIAYIPKSMLNSTVKVIYEY